MAATTTRSVFGGTTGNSFSSTTTQIADSQIRYVDKGLEFLDPSSYPLQKAIGYGKGIAVRKVEWADDRLPPNVDQLAEALDDSETGVDVDNGSRFQAGHLVKVDDEIMLVASISTNTLTVTRAFSGTTAAAHADNAVIRIIGIALAENMNTPPSPVADGGLYYNFMQLWDGGHQMSHRANENGVENYLIRRKERNKRTDQLFQVRARDFEYGLFHGRRLDASSTAPSTMGGFPQFITEHVTDLNDAALTRTSLRSLWQATFNDVDKANMAKTVICSGIGKEILNSFYDPARTLTATDRRVTEVLDAIVTDYGTITFMLHHACPEDEMYGVDLSNYSLHPFGSYGRWHMTERPADGEFIKIAVSGDYTGIFKGDRAHWKISDFNTSRSNYASLND